MIKINNTDKQQVDILAPMQDIISIENDVYEQGIEISEVDSAQELEIIQSECQNIGISIPCPAKLDLMVAIDTKVPKALSILPQIQGEQLATSVSRDVNRMYVDVAGSPAFVTIEQIKQLNTKTVLVDKLTDEVINALSDGDIILLGER